MILYNPNSPHPFERSEALVINVETGQPFELKDLFRSSYHNTLNELAILELKRQGNYFPCDERRPNPKTGSKEDPIDEVELGMLLATGYVPKICFLSVKDNTNYFLTSDSIVLTFSRYEIAPGVAGIVEVPVPLINMKNLINPNGPLARFM